ncbi:MAG: undecaprenyl-diphosphate phosphatase [Candidatus Saganbacteria bacterium]|nr:undecaprenyl-diphosphate phosphatase [Candidatus Saganbacteria bacterium]
MTILQSVVLGVVQGIAEFLPISSSAHLVFIPWLLGWPEHTLTFDVALHLGTLVSLLAFFWREWWGIIRGKLVWLLLLGSVPGALAGVLGEKYFEETFRGPVTIAVFLISLGLLLWAAEVFSRRRRELASVGWLDAGAIGLAQALALMPGVSRAGITMTAGLFLGLKRETAAKFSFLLSAPIILGAGLYKSYGLFKHGGLPADERMPFLAGLLTAALVGFFAIKYLLRYLQKNTFYLFIWYRLLVGAGLIALVLLRLR